MVATCFTEMRVVAFFKYFSTVYYQTCQVMFFSKINKQKTF